ncbi:proliferating cell nuclear antigen [Hamiltosporidium tvaerminnensis]|uniref:DNA sliding clamp PCNA n=1 Tax=Hamiltosporidium tvaerminnensis TaxID=1176355 RepID=A0A4Q9M0Z0_9MICR|nr:proliferating cell nuclear antigen [Hamiltosporidium tvaerminnensis]
MFELKITQAADDKTVVGGRGNLVKRVLESLADLVDDVEFKVSDKGMCIQTMDSMHVALADIFLSRDIFESYRCDRSLTLGIKLKEFLKILRNIKMENNSTFMMYCDDDATKLIIVNECEGFSLHFNLKLFDFEIESYNMSDVQYEAEIEMPTSRFLLLPKIVGTFAEYIVFEADKDKISFSQSGEMTESCLTLKPHQFTESESNSFSVTSHVKKEVAMKYLNCCAKSASLCERVKISLGNRTPVFLDFSLGDLGYIRYYIAPKDDSED